MTPAPSARRPAGPRRAARFSIAVVSGTAHRALAEELAAELGVTVASVAHERFPDGEQRVRIDEDLRGRDVYLVQPLSPPADEHLIELLLLADAARRMDAGRVTAIVPYLAYARQERRDRAGEPIGARIVADALASAGVERLVSVDVHAPALEAAFAMPLAHLSAVPLLADRLRGLVTPEYVVIAPDLGATKLAESYALALDLTMATVRKTRVSGTTVRAEAILGNVAGRRMLVVDDMISTGATVEAAVGAATAAGALPDLLIAASHGLLVGPACDRLRRLGPTWVVVTDSIPPALAVPCPRHIAALAPRLAQEVRSLAGSAEPG